MGILPILERHDWSQRGAAIASILVGGPRPTLGGLAGSNMTILISSLGAAIVGMAPEAGARARLRARHRLVEFVSLLTLLLTLAWTLPEASWALTGDQHLTVIYAHWYPNDSSYVYNSKLLTTERAQEQAQTRRRWPRESRPMERHTVARASRAGKPRAGQTRITVERPTPRPRLRAWTQSSARPRHRLSQRAVQ